MRTLVGSGKIKILFISLALAVLALFFASCDVLFPLQETPVLLELSYSYKEVSLGTSLAEATQDLLVWEGGSSIPLEEVKIEGRYDPTLKGQYALTIKHGDRSAALTLSVEAEGVLENASFPTLQETADTFGLSYGIPQTGEVELLVIPIGFANKRYENAEETLEIAFNGSAEDTGWQSLASFYEISSFGKLKLHATIMPTYESDRRQKSREKSSIDKTLLREALAYYDSELDYSAFDANGDGSIDCVYLIYLAPYEEDSDLWWAYQDTVESSFMTYDGKKPNVYLWMSIDFFFDPILYEYDKTDDLGVSVNTETLIHETGHAIGLDDYYDYVEDDVEYGGLGYLNMMDGSYGDHDPFSKAILGWIHPTFVYRADYETALRPYEESGDAIIIAKTGENTYFQEYFILCYYTPTGLFEIKADKDVGVFSVPGILIYHVSADLKERKHITDLVEIYAANNGSDPRLIRICEADDDDSVDSFYYAEDDDLFQAGDSFSPVWNDGTDAGFTLDILYLKDRAGVKIEFENKTAEAR